MRALISLDIEKKGQENWSEYLSNSNLNYYKERVVKLIVAHNKEWSKCNQVRKTEVLKGYLKPFTFDENYIANVIIEIDNKLGK